MNANRAAHGFTLVEMLMVVMIAVVLVVLAAPSFQGVLDRQRLRSMTSNLSTDIQYARSEAVRRNSSVTVSFSAATWCYGIVAGTAACDCTQAGSCALKTVSGSDFPNTTMALTGGSGLTIDPRQGGVAAVAGGGSGAVTTAVDFASTTTPDAQLRTTINSLGRVLQCAPSGANITGYPAC